MRLFRSVIRWVRKLLHMRRKIQLYIADQLVDLDDQSFILFNYQMDDLSNPTIVKNSWSQQITLKGTPANNQIFGGSFQADRRVEYMGGETGVDFNPSKKTPFTIYDEMGQILESGYVKLDSITKVGADIQYKVTLYGGLGSFFYALSYDENGNKRTLADLDYLGTGNPDSELTFTINAESVRNAWSRLRTDTSAPAMFDVINFAPAYNGIPEGNFSPDKGLILPSDVGLQDTITQDDVAFTTKAGYSLVNLAEAQDEWAVKDLRSYMQRPVFSMRAFWNAICNQNNNGGFEVDASVIQDYLTFGGFTDLWMTLPLISSIGTIKEETGSLTLSLSSTPTTGRAIGQYTINGSIPAGTKVTTTINCKIRFNVPSGADSYSTLYRSASESSGRTTNTKTSAIFLQAVAYGSDDSIIGGSKIKVIGASGREGGRSLAEACGYVPAWSADYDAINVGNFTKVSAGVWQIPTELGFQVIAQDVAYYKIQMSVYPGTIASTGDGRGQSTIAEYTGTGNTSTPAMYVDYDTSFTPNSTYIVNGSAANIISYVTPKTLRSGATITKAMLLSSSHTPAEYMLSFCKVFGLYFVYDPATRKVTICRRNDLYQDETIDLTRRVDVSKGISIKPMVFSAKWYDFLLDGVGGAFMEEYENVEGMPYGIQRVNTGYDFDAASVNLMNSVVFKNACTILARSKYFNIISEGHAETEIPIDTSSITSNHRYLDASNVWKNNVSINSIMYPVNPGERYRFHVGNLTQSVAVMQNNSQTLNSAGVFATGYQGKFMPTEGQEITIPSDGHYLFIIIKGFDGVSDTSISRLEILQMFIPSPFLDKGNTYTLWSPDGNTIETDISCPPTSASVVYYNDNPLWKGYDVNSARKLELRTADNKPVDGSDILVFLEGWSHYDGFKLTDDVPAMDVVNDGVPCWLLAEGTESLYVPTFQRYTYGNLSVIENSLDFGIPGQFDIPGVRHAAGCTIYERAWKAYMADRYDVNTKVMSCQVNFGGIQVGQDLLRKFYWYDNSLWVLNAIKNYSITTYDPVECEFVQVQDKENYLNGQSY